MIKQGKHLNMNSIVLESDFIKLSILPELGFKIASIVFKPKQKEFLFQPTLGKYEIPSYGDFFHLYDTSGMDEMLPTVDKCIYPVDVFSGSVLPDHGDVWSLPWNFIIKDNKVKGIVKLKSLPLEFHKIISFKNDTTIRMDYRVKNLSAENVSYLWALHGLNVFDDSTEFIYSEDMNDVLNVEDEKDLSKIDLKYLKNYEDKNSYKYYFTNEIKEGIVGLDYTDERIRYIINYDTKINPYLGVWISKGGFKGEYNCAIEPSNGFYDNLEIAYRNNKVPFLKSLEEKYWTVDIEIKQY